MVPAMSVLALTDTAVPADAPAPQRGETPWFRGDQKPVQIGVYKRLALGRKVLFSYFDGATWFWSAGTADEAFVKMRASLVQNLPWLGLAEPPAEGYGHTTGVGRNAAWRC